MDNKEYVAAFTARKYYGPQRNQSPEDFFTNPDLERSLVDVRGWGRHFSVLMRRHLNNQPLNVKSESATLEDYLEWNLTNINPILDEVLDATKEDPRNIKYASDLTFHIANYGMEEQWRSIIDPERTHTTEKLAKTQSWMANRAVSLIMRQRAILKANHGDERDVAYFALGSQLSEIDTHIALLEMIKPINPNISVVPAPPDFESTYAIRNADIMLLDRDKQQVHGVQVKTALFGARSHAKKVLSYDPDFVTVIDGAHELGNVMYVKKPGQSDKVAKITPGLLSMDHLSRTSVKDLTDRRYHYSTLQQLQARAIARELSKNRKNFIPQAVKNIQSKVLHGLYKEPSRSFIHPEQREA